MFAECENDVHKFVMTSSECALISASACMVAFVIHSFFAEWAVGCGCLNLGSEPLLDSNHKDSLWRKLRPQRWDCVKPSRRQPRRGAGANSRAICFLRNLHDCVPLGRIDSRREVTLRNVREVLHGFEKIFFCSFAQHHECGVKVFCISRIPAIQLRTRQNRRYVGGGSM